MTGKELTFDSKILPTVQKDAIDIYIENELKEFKEELKIRERLIREGFAKEEAAMEEQDKYYEQFKRYASSTDEMSLHIDLLNEVYLGEDYTMLAKEMNIRQFEAMEAYGE